MASDEVSPTESEATPPVDELARRLQVALGDGYAVQRPLGSGGFAVVYLVRDLTLKRDLAVKVLSPDLISTEAQLARFRREAEMIAGLSHPNIVPLHFVGGSGDLFYLAMQCVAGGSLADRIAREKTLPVDDVIRVLTEIASALGHAHKRGVVHRDIKPQNVLVDDESGRCLLTDFGIARGDDSGPLTATGIVVGTPAYLAPERIMGEKSDHRADIYAVGVMAYELLAGNPPFHGPTPMAGMMKRLEGPPQSLRALRDDVPKLLEDVVNGCLAVDPADRFQNAGEIVRALTGATPSSGGQPTRDAAIRKRPVDRKKQLPFVVAGGAVVIAAAAWLAFANKARSVTPTTAPGSTPIDTSMATIAGGSFTIGSDSGAPIARPAHVLRLASFAIGRHEVSIGEYKAFADSTGARHPWAGAMPDSRLPVTKVLWSEAVTYCGWRYKPNGRLPTEEEWEATARGSANRAFPWGNAFDASLANTQSSNRGHTIAVGTIAGGATPEGVADMIGNVWEWTNSAPTPYAVGSALPDSMRNFRVIRGGAFNTPSKFATSWHRGYAPQVAQPDDLEFTGFRCAMSLPASSQ